MITAPFMALMGLVVGTLAIKRVREPICSKLVPTLLAILPISAFISSWWILQAFDADMANRYKADILRAVDKIVRSTEFQQVTLALYSGDKTHLAAFDRLYVDYDGLYKAIVDTTTANAPAVVIGIVGYLLVFTLMVCLRILWWIQRVINGKKLKCSLLHYWTSEILLYATITGLMITSIMSGWILTVHHMAHKYIWGYLIPTPSNMMQNLTDDIFTTVSMTMIVIYTFWNITIYISAKE